QLDRAGLMPAVLAAASSKPLLGVCVGMQMLFTTSEEAPDTGGLNIFPGDVPRFHGAAFQDESAVSGTLLKVPHMGWNRVWQTGHHALWEGIPDGAHFYFVHSYFVQPQDPAITVGTTRYGID